MSEITRQLDAEHRESLDLLGKIEQSLARSSRTVPDPSFAPLARDLARSLADDINRHFRFEEHELFPRLAAAGEADIATLLTEEHVAIRAVSAEVLPGLLAAAAGSLGADDYPSLKRGTLELVERLVAHIQKETMALLPMIEALVDADTDRELSFAYAAG